MNQRIELRQGAGRMLESLGFKLVNPTHIIILQLEVNILKMVVNVVRVLQVKEQEVDIILGTQSQYNLAYIIFMENFRCVQYVA